MHKRRTWLVVLPTASPLEDADWFSAFTPIPHEIEPRDRIAMVCWPQRGMPILAATAAVARLSFDTGTLKLRHRVAAVAGHIVAVTDLGTRLAAARGWTRARREALIGRLQLITQADFELIESALLDVAHRYGPPPRRPVHSRPRTPGRRALIAGRSANPRGRAASR